MSSPTNLKTISYTSNGRQGALKQLELDLLFFPLKFVQFIAKEFIVIHKDRLHGPKINVKDHHNQSNQHFPTPVKL